jgi:hypothetical protein
MVRELILERLFDDGDDTVGILKDVTKSFSRTILGFTCEDQKQNGPKIPGETRIPADRYEIVLNKVETPLTLKYRAKYPWFKWHLMIKGVKGFIGIYIHIGNDDDHTDGCILVGDVMNNISLAKFDKLSIQDSTASFERFYKAASRWLEEGNQMFITIVDEKY